MGEPHRQRQGPDGAGRDFAGGGGRIAGYYSLGEEIWSQTKGKIDAFVHCAEAIQTEYQDRRGRAALFYETGALWAYAGGFLVLTDLVVVLYEEPTLRQTFGEDYKTYCRQVRRWWPTP